MKSIEFKDQTEDDQAALCAPIVEMINRLYPEKKTGKPLMSHKFMFIDFSTTNKKWI